MSKEIINKVYTAEMLCDLLTDIDDAIDYADAEWGLDKDEYGFFKGRFRLRLEWEDDE